MPKLTVSALKAAKHPGGVTRPVRIGDGEGLYLQISTGGSKSWLFRYTLAGKAREMGLGAVALSPSEEAAGAVPLARARDLARAAQAKLREGLDPIEARRGAEVAAEAKTAPATFQEVAEAMLDVREAEWSNPKHRQQWRNTLATYVYPIIGAMPVVNVETDDVRKVLAPIWREKPETGARVKMRVLAVLRYARAAGQRPTGSSAADMDEALRTLLPKTAPLKRAAGYGHHAALPWGDMSAFMAELRQRPATAARALEFLILTATRTGETLGARWREFDMAGRTWLIPAERMKAKKPHRVPLSDAAMTVLTAMQAQAAGSASPVFPGDLPGEPLSQMALLMLLRRMNPAEKDEDGEATRRWSDPTSGDSITAHGFRSSFRDWAGEATSTPHAVMEASLAHANGDKVEAAYARGDLFAKRRVLMEQWAEHCGRAPTAVHSLDDERARRAGREEKNASA